MTGFEPRRFGKYQILDRIAVGGMAELYLARITGAQGFEKLVVLKKILPHLAVEDELVNSFIEEAKLAAFLHHENIVQIYDFGCMEGSYFIAMEHLSGKDLRSVIHKGKLMSMPPSLENALYITSRICEGLDYSHNLTDFQGQALNIIHRDINPQNIFVTYDGQIKIIDYGIAKASSQKSGTQTDLIKGKLSYMSPEQAGGRAIDHRSDIFSTGIILYELVTGKKMYEGETRHVFAKVKDAHYEPPEEVVDYLPPELCRIIRRALQKEPAGRYQAADDMLKDLDECMARLSYRPTTRGFSRYMKTLFQEESLSDLQAIQSVLKEDADAAYPTMPAFSGTDAVSQPHTEAEPTVYEPVNGLPGKKNRVTRTGLAAGMLLFLVLWALNLNWGSRLTGESHRLNPVSIAGQKAGASDRKLPAPTPVSALPEPAQHEAPVPIDSKKPVSAAAPPVSNLMADGLAALDAGRFEEAISCFSDLLEKNPASRTRIVSPYARALTEQAAVIINREPRSAERMLVKALALTPDNPEIAGRLGMLYIRQEQFPRAIDAYRKAISASPGNADFYFNLGYVYAMVRDYRSAEKMFSRTVELSPDYTDEALFNLAMVRDKQGNAAQAIKDLMAALEKNPENEPARRYLSRLKTQGPEKK